MDDRKHGGLYLDAIRQQNYIEFAAVLRGKIVGTLTSCDYELRLLHCRILVGQVGSISATLGRAKIESN